MTNCPTTLLSVEIPTSTYRMLEAYAKARNGPLSNSADAAIRDGIEAMCLLHPNFRERAGLPEPRPQSTACRLVGISAPPPPAPGERDLTTLLASAKAHVESMSPEERDAMLKAQAESWARGMAPCEHGNRDWEQCPKCRAKAASQHQQGGEKT